jgi:hypothetical protein
MQKIQKICFLKELGLFHRESSLFLGKGALLLGELGPLPKERHYYLRKLFLFLVQFFSKGISFILEEFHFAPHGTYIVP